MSEPTKAANAAPASTKPTIDEIRAHAARAREKPLELESAKSPRPSEVPSELRTRIVPSDLSESQQAAVAGRWTRQGWYEWPERLTVPAFKQPCRVFVMTEADYRVWHADKTARLKGALQRVSEA